MFCVSCFRRPACRHMYDTAHYSQCFPSQQWVEEHARPHPTDATDTRSDFQVPFSRPRARKSGLVTRSWARFTSRACGSLCGPNVFFRGDDDASENAMMTTTTTTMMMTNDDDDDDDDDDDETATTTTTTNTTTTTTTTTATITATTTTTNMTTITATTTTTTTTTTAATITTTTTTAVLLRRLLAGARDQALVGLGPEMVIF